MSRKPVTIRRLRPIINGRELTEAQHERFKALTDQVFTAQGEGHMAKTEGDRKLAERIEKAGVAGLRALASELAGQAREARANADLTETLATRRDHFGDEVGTVTVEGSEAIKVRTADALQWEYDHGTLDGAAIPAKDLLRTGATYRQCYEATAAMLTPEKNEVRGSCGGGIQDAIVYAGQTLAILRRRMGPKHIEVLDAVCGLDMIVRRAEVRLRSDHRTVARRLREGLVMATDNFDAS